MKKDYRSYIIKYSVDEIAHLYSLCDNYVDNLKNKQTTFADHDIC